MFGLSFGELCVLLIVAMVVLGPKELPRYLRKAGQIAGRLRRMAFEMREKSGIDEVLRTEGLEPWGDQRSSASSRGAKSWESPPRFGRSASWRASMRRPRARGLMPRCPYYGGRVGRRHPGLVPSSEVHRLADGLVVVRER